MSKVIETEDKILGVVFEDGTRRWFDESTFDKAIEEMDDKNLTSFLKDNFNDKACISDETKMTYAEVYERANGSAFSDFINRKVSEYRIAAERFSSKNVY